MAIRRKGSKGPEKNEDARRFPKTDIPSGPKTLSKEDVFNYLKTIAPLSQAMKKLLKVPDKLFSLEAGPAVSLSLSSSPTQGIAYAAERFYSRTDEPMGKMQLPDYGIYVFNTGSTGYCMIYDAGRKILACAEVANMFGKPSFDELGSEIKDSLKAAKNLDTKKYPFVFNGSPKKL